MDPATILGTAVAAGKAAFQIAVTVYSFVDDTVHVDETIQSLCLEVDSLKGAIAGVQTALKSPTIQAVAQSSAEDGNSQIWISVNGSLEACLKTLAAFNGSLKDVVKKENSRNPLQRPLRAIMLNLKDASIVRYRRQLHTHTLAMEAAIVMINLEVGIQGQALLAPLGPKVDLLIDLVQRLKIDQENRPRDLDPDELNVSQTTESLRTAAEDTVTSAATVIGSESGMSVFSLTDETSSDRRAEHSDLPGIVLHRGSNSVRGTPLDPEARNRIHVWGHLTEQRTKPSTQSTEHPLRNPYEEIQDSLSPDSNVEEDVLVDLIKSLIAQGERRVGREDYTGAEKFYRQALNQAKFLSSERTSWLDLAARKSLFACYCQIPKCDNAKEILESMDFSGTDGSQINNLRHDLVGAFLKEGRFEDAKNSLVSLELEENLDSRSMYKISALCKEIFLSYLNRTQLDDAESVLCLFRSWTSGNLGYIGRIASLYHILFDKYLVNGRLDEAENVLSLLMEDTEDSAVTQQTWNQYHRLVYEYLKTDRLSEAEKACRKELGGRRRTMGVLHPDYYASLSLLAFIYDVRGEPEVAKGYYYQLSPESRGPRKPEDLSTDEKEALKRLRGRYPRCFDMMMSGAFSWAAKMGDLSLVRLLLRGWLEEETKRRRFGRSTTKLVEKQCTYINLVGSDGKPPLCHAAENGYTAVAAALIFKGARRDARSQIFDRSSDTHPSGGDGYTALDLAIVNNHHSTVAFLVKYESMVNAKSSLGRTALCVAAEKGNLTAIDMLISSGANIDQVYQYSYTSQSSVNNPLFYAAQCGALETYKRLLQQNASFEYGRGHEKTTAFHAAARSGQLTVLQYIVQSGVNIDVKDGNNRSAYDLAKEYGKTDAANYLLKRGASVTSPSSSEKALGQPTPANQSPQSPGIEGYVELE